MYMYKNYELEHYEIEYMNMQYETIWICEYMKLYNLHTVMNIHIYDFIHAHVQCI